MRVAFLMLCVVVVISVAAAVLAPDLIVALVDAPGARFVIFYFSLVVATAIVGFFWSSFSVRSLHSLIQKAIRFNAYMTSTLCGVSLVAWPSLGGEVAVNSEDGMMVDIVMSFSNDTFFCLTAFVIGSVVLILLLLLKYSVAANERSFGPLS